MPYIPSANKDIPAIAGPTTEVQYRHPVDSANADGVRGSGIPMVFQITSPFDIHTVLLPHALVMHVNPRGFNETFNKKVERIQTRGGFVEQHWGDDLGEISCDASTGAFVSLTTGLSSVVRERTIAWDRYRDLHDLYRNNGSVTDPTGAVVLQGHVMLLYDRGTYIGYFKSFSVEETDDSPFAFNLSWSFKVEKTVLKMPTNDTNLAPRVPQFQTQNGTQSQNSG